MTTRSQCPRTSGLPDLQHRLDRTLDLHLLIVLEILGFPCRDLPRLAVAVHLDATEVLNPLRRLRQEVELRAAETAEVLLPLGAHELDADGAEQDDERQAEAPSGPAASREGTPALERHARKIPSQIRLVKLRNR